MRAYDPSLPLIAIHIPKTGGVSIQQIYKEWFGDGFLTHYKEKGGSLPERHDLPSIQSQLTPTVVYGHFNKLRKFGIEQYYPEVEQGKTFVATDSLKLNSASFKNVKTASNAWAWTTSTCSTAASAQGSW